MMRWVGANMDIRNYVWKPRRKIPLSKCRHKWGDIISMDLKLTV
jgi:hypothetical protein